MNGEAPSCITETVRTAKKAHKCCECGSVINPGDKYRYTSGVWNSQGQSFKQCLHCTKLFDGYRDFIKADYDGFPSYRNLRWDLQELCCQSYSRQNLARDLSIHFPAVPYHHILKLVGADS